MKKGEQLSGTVTEVKFPNKAVVQCEDGSVCIVKNGLPGQKISFVVTKKRNGQAQGRLLEVLEPAANEIPSCCPHFGICGGCSCMTLPYAAQLALKESQVKSLLCPILAKQDIPCTWEPIRPNPQIYGYRNKMEFSFGDGMKDGPLELGMHKKGSFYDIVTVSECQIVDGDYRKILPAVLAYFRERNISFYHRLRHTGYLRHLLVRKGRHTGEILLALITTTQETHDLTAFKDMLLSLSLEGTITGILHIENDSAADAVKCDSTVILYGKEYFYEELLGLKFKISPFSFFQTNSPGAEVLYETARDFIGSAGAGARDGILFDLYSGTGTIAQIMSGSQTGNRCGNRGRSSMGSPEKCSVKRSGKLHLPGRRRAESSGHGRRKTGFHHTRSPKRRYPSQSPEKNHRLRSGRNPLYFLQTHQPGQRSGSIPCKRVCCEKGHLRGSVFGNRACGDGCVDAKGFCT